MELPEDCLRCGACCFSAAIRYVPVTGADWSRLGRDAEHLAHFIGNRAYMKMTDHHCAALELRAVSEGGCTYFCTIYAHRPQVCRDLERASPQCAGERHVKPSLATVPRDSSSTILNA
ncbi:YkgJ family cysteine cluster protein [Opitutus sp. ER46]|uniref:YkgJ family cysteine cluster protein n=1 Tax=Opitutus sp. ER46 TaxID=2161864 RepID=UPI000D2F8C20|nr:YkgJ family cysteine cluster protein [Opitutus sp. ER46]PTX98549.1 hypothetical protein DB354_04610 [Opitutus sp. ER46]